MARGVTLILLSLLVGATRGAAQTTHVAASCNKADIDTKTGLAVTGDTVEVPAGSCTWTSALATWGSKNLTLRGAGRDQTIITLTGGDTYKIGVQMGDTASRVTGFQFRINSTNGNGAVYARGNGWRVDNNSFFQDVTAVGKTGVIIDCSTSAGIDMPDGVVDHNYFFNLKVLHNGNLDSKAAATWYEATKIGNSDQSGVVYVEDNVFVRSGSSTEDVMDATEGGRYVFRYNRVTNGAIDVHGMQQSPIRFSAKSWEIYGNICHSNEGTTRAVQIRAGTGVVYNNTVTGNYTFWCDLDNQRSWTLMSDPPDDCNGSAACDGNEVGLNGYPCRDQIGRGPDSSLWDGVTYAMPSQALEPAHFWHNTDDGVFVNPQVAYCGNNVKTNGSCADIVLGRDYYNSPRTGYQAYTYPHPLVTGTYTGPGGRVRLRGALRDGNLLSDFIDMIAELVLGRWRDESAEARGGVRF